MLPPLTGRQPSSPRQERQSPSPLPTPPQRSAGLLSDYTYGRNGDYSAWAFDPTVLLAGRRPTRPPPKRYPQKAKAPALESSPRGPASAEGAFEPAGEADVVNAESAAAVIEERQRWAGPSDFESSKVYQQWTRVLKEGQKLRDKCRTWDKAVVYPVWLIPKERAGEPPRGDEVKARQKHAAQVKLAKEAALREKERQKEQEAKPSTPTTPEPQVAAEVNRPWLQQVAGKPPSKEEIKARHKQAADAKLAKEAALLEKQRLAKEAKKRKAREARGAADGAEASPETEEEQQRLS